MKSRAIKPCSFSFRQCFLYRPEDRSSIKEGKAPQRRNPLINLPISLQNNFTMPYQYKREPLNDDEVNKLTNACDTFREKFVVWTLFDTGLTLSEFADLKKDNIRWQERRLVIYGKGGPYGKKTKRRIIPMTD